MAQRTVSPMSLDNLLPMYQVHTGDACSPSTSPPHPTAEWALQQFWECLPEPHGHRFFLQDRDSIYSFMGIPHQAIRNTLKPRSASLRAPNCTTWVRIPAGFKGFWVTDRRDGMRGNLAQSRRASRRLSQTLGRKYSRAASLDELVAEDSVSPADPHPSFSVTRSRPGSPAGSPPPHRRRW
jgi:hypothetical protein